MSNHDGVSTDISTANAIHDCWNKIGVWGNASCSDLERHVHCRNCPIYSAAAAKLLGRALPAGYMDSWTNQLAQEREIEAPNARSVLVFRIGTEWLALPTRMLTEIADLRTVHSLPHRRGDGILGLVNVREELLVCVSLDNLPGLEHIEESREESRLVTRKRLLVASHEGHRLVFPVDEVAGVCHFRDQDLLEIPATRNKATIKYMKAALPWREKSVGLLDEQFLSDVAALASAPTTILATEDGQEALNRLETQTADSPEPRSAEVANSNRELSNRKAQAPAEKLNRLFRLAGESLVASRWLKPYVDSISRLSRMQRDSYSELCKLREALSHHVLSELAQTALDNAARSAAECEKLLSQRLTELEAFDQRSTNLSQRLYDAAASCYMHALSDGVRAPPCMVRTLVVDIGGEPYAFPLAHIAHIVKVSKEKIELHDGRPHFHFNDRPMSLVAARQLLTGEQINHGDELRVVMVGNHEDTYGLVVDSFLGERELVVQPLDSRLGKIKGIAAGALMDDGSPVLIVDVEDMILSVEKLIC